MKPSEAERSPGASSFQAPFRRQAVAVTGIGSSATVQKVSGKKLIQHYEQLLAQDPKDVRLLQKLAEAFQKAGENIKAAATIARVAESYEHDGFFLKAVAQLKQAVKLDPERNDINLRLADVHHKLQLLSEAIAYLHLGLRNAQRKQDADTCLIASRRLTELDPTNPQLRLAYARLLLRADRKEEAKEELVAAGKAIAPRPSRPRCRSGRG